MKNLYTFVVGKKIFTIIKPGFLNLASDIIKMMEEVGEPCQMRTKQLLLSEAKQLYKVHKDEKWYGNLCEYMSSGPSMAVMYTNHTNMTQQELIDATVRIKDKIRKKWGIDDCKNVMHSSDSVTAMEHESQFYF